MMRSVHTDTCTVTTLALPLTLPCVQTLVCITIVYHSPKKRSPHESKSLQQYYDTDEYYY